MSGDQLNLDEIQRLAYDEGYWSEQTILALVAEVRHLRDQAEVVARHRFCRDCGATLEQCQRYRLGRAIKCCPDCRHDPA